MSGPQVVVPQFLPAPLADRVDVYANQIRMGATLSDFTIIFGTTEDVGSGHVMNRDRVTVRLAPATAKLLQLNLMAVLEAHEQVLGTIAVSERMLAQLADAKAKILTLYQDQMQGGADAQVSETEEP